MSHVTSATSKSSEARSKAISGSASIQTKSWWMMKISSRMRMIMYMLPARLATPAVARATASWNLTSVRAKPAEETAFLMSPPMAPLAFAIMAAAPPPAPPLLMAPMACCIMELAAPPPPAPPPWPPPAPPPRPPPPPPSLPRLSSRKELACCTRESSPRLGCGGGGGGGGGAACAAGAAGVDLPALERRYLATAALRNLSPYSDMASSAASSKKSMARRGTPQGVKATYLTRAKLLVIAALFEETI